MAASLPKGGLSGGPPRRQPVQRGTGAGQYESMIDGAEYKQFRASVPKKQIPVGSKVWKIYDFGPRNVPPLVMLPGTSGTADVFFHQVLSLGYRGYRVISAQYPDYWSTDQFVRGFKGFLEAMKIQKCHLFGASLGGFLALHFTAAYPEHVLSISLCNSFVDNSAFAQSENCVAMFGWLPQFYLQKYILDSFPQVTIYPEAIDFAVTQLESLDKNDLGARLTLNCRPSEVPKLKFDESKISIIDTHDEVVLPNSLRERLYKRFPKSRPALIKDGGDFPFLSNPSQLSLHLQVHLRSAGLRPDLNMSDSEVKSESERLAAEKKMAARDLIAAEEGSKGGSLFFKPGQHEDAVTTEQDEQDLDEVLDAMVDSGEAAVL